eukprot:gnl/TRDRNA2_/TRDRNA2_129720_c0_seq1.p1 gnl/TRDRNA2_/TRDRNA2_129720_c0~~gnl/TRDRNA2_/TRDRNA2_129720_c0_seq1.p1  ORF type:complete len:355 (+),score=54.82 gnl/TRDRNA2_/TRDRNA2_129720_c0_seq1:201-1265(+)
MVQCLCSILQSFVLLRMITGTYGAGSQASTKKIVGLSVTAKPTTAHQRASLHKAKEIAQLDPAAANRMVAHVLKLDIGTAGFGLADENYGDQRRHKALTEVLCKDDRASAVVKFAAMRSKFRWLTAPMLLRALLVLRTPVQIAYFNDPAFAASEAFPLLCDLLTHSNIWALNLGEIVFTRAQGRLLAKALTHSGVGFLFVDSVLSGASLVRQLKDVIKDNRARRMANGDEPWLFSEKSEAQNLVIKQCISMWFNPTSLKRNVRFEQNRKVKKKRPKELPMSGKRSLVFAQKSMHSRNISKAPKGILCKPAFKHSFRSRSAYVPVLTIENISGVLSIPDSFRLSWLARLEGLEKD